MKISEVLTTINSNIVDILTYSLEYRKDQLCRIGETYTETSIDWNIADYAFYSLINGNAKTESRNLGGQPSLWVTMPVKLILLGSNRSDIEVTDKLISLISDAAKCNTLGFREFLITKIWVTHDPLIKDLYRGFEPELVPDTVGISAIDATVGFYLDCFIETC